MPGTDGELRSLTIARLSDSRYAAAIATARAQVSDRLATLTAEIDQIEELAAALSEKVGRREMALADFDKSYSFLRADLEPLLAEREQLSGGAIDGPNVALSSVDVARHWDEAESVAERRAMLVDAIGRPLRAPGDPWHAHACVQPGPDRARTGRCPALPAHDGVSPVLSIGRGYVCRQPRLSAQAHAYLDVRVQRQLRTSPEFFIVAIIALFATVAGFESMRGLIERQPVAGWLSAGRPDGRGRVRLGYRGR